MKAACITLAACVLFTANAAADESVNRTLAADPKGEVEISNVAGTITVTGWDRGEVQVTGNLGNAVERLDFESDKSRTLVKVVLRRGSHRGGSDTDLTVRVPQASRINVNTVSAEIMTKGVIGQLRLQSVSGDISSEVTQEDADIKTVSGTIQLRGNGKPGVLSVTTVSGDANVSRVAGEVNASTVSGTLELGLDEVSRAKLRTTSGDLNISGRLKSDAKVDGETISGQLTVDLKGSTDLQVDIESFSGDIDNCGSQQAERTSKYGPGSELRYTVGKGTGRIRLESLSGDISLCVR